LRAEEIVRLRLANHHLTAPHLSDPARLVAHLGAVQSQDYGAAKWAVGQRLVGATDDAVERAFDSGDILRTHVLRPTWHFVAPADIRWLLSLTGPRVKAAMAHYDRKLGLDARLISRSMEVIADALRGGKHLTRSELDAALRGAGIAAKDGQTLGNIVMHAELDAVICSGPRRGKQFTYALLEERVPAAAVPASAPQDRDAALAELTTRYFSSHGPATAHDFAWWSGLTLGDTARGIEVAGRALTHETVDDLTYWFSPSAQEPPAKDGRVFLLPNYDEYTVAYKHRDLYYDASRKTGNPREDVPFGNAIVVAGRVAGSWSRTLGAETVTVETRWFGSPTRSQQRAVQTAIQRYAAFLELNVGRVETVE
jgi:hypothetical protein